MSAVLANMLLIAKSRDVDGLGLPLACGVLNGWTVSTDGHCLVAVEGDLGAAPFPETLSPQTSSSTIASYVSGLVADWPAEAGVDLAALRTWSGRERVLREACRDCKQDGKGAACTWCSGQGTTLCVCGLCDDEHRAQCDTCDGRGFGNCLGCGLEPTYPRLDGVVLGVPLNRHLLANALRFLPGTVVSLGLHAEKQTRGGDNIDPSALWLRGEGWRAAVMPLAQTAEELAKLPVFGVPEEAEAR